MTKPDVIRSDIYHILHQEEDGTFYFSDQFIDDTKWIAMLSDSLCDYNNSEHESVYQIMQERLSEECDAYKAKYAVLFEYAAIKIQREYGIFKQSDVLLMFFNTPREFVVILTTKQMICLQRDPLVAKGIKEFWTTNVFDLQ